MNFTSVIFPLFLLASLFLYYICPKKQRWLCLLAVSYVFYLSGGIHVLGYILFTTLTTYLSGLLIGRTNANAIDKQSKAKCRKKAKLYATAVLILNFGLLYFVKYWNFTLDILHVKEGLLRVDILMPLGISFYIFQSMGYIIDLVRNKYQPQKNFFKFATFVSFFPQLIQGPISRYDKLSHQLYEGNDFSFDNIKSGLMLILGGYIKKLVIADRAAVAVNSIIDNYTNYSGSVILFGILFYCIQLYCDFSGGIDVARGVSKLFGIEMPLNFKRPIFATSLTDFWRRWHITLGSWLKDYLFYPITLSKPFISLGRFMRKHIKGKAGKILPTSLATFIVYFVIGIWHGASWKYIAFGLWNGCLITASLLLEPVFFEIKSKLSIKDNALWYKIICIIRTTVIVVLGRYITRASGLGAAVDMLLRTVRNFNYHQLVDGTLLSLGITSFDFVIVIVGAILLFLFELHQEMGKPITEKAEQKGIVPTFILLLAGMVVLVFLGIYSGDYISSEFIYKQF